MDFENVVKVKKTVSQKDFMREVLLGLSRDSRTPADIMTAKFGTVTESTEEFIIVSTEIDVSYSGEIGYDRQEDYIVEERKHLDEGSIYTYKGVTKVANQSGFYYMDVKKTRTVTDWQPHSGTLHDSRVSAEINQSTEDDSFTNLFIDQIKKTKNDNKEILSESTSKLNSSAFERVKKGCESQARLAVRWPGDHQKGERYSCKTEVTSISCYIVPCYYVEFEYDNKKYYAKGLAFASANETHIVPENKAGVLSESDLSSQKYNEISEKTKVPKILKVVGMAIGIIGFIAAVGGLFDPESSTLLIIGIIALVGGFGTMIGSNITIKSKTKTIETKYDELIQNLTNEKLAALEKRLAEMSFAPLTKIEKEVYFNQK